jgi:uncharacterized integral membrane protein
VARNRGHEPVRAERTRTSSTLAAVSVAVIFMVLLIIFIAQNNKKVPLHFLGASGSVSEALAIVASAVAGAVLVLSIGIARVVQLRVGGRRHNRAMKKQAETANASDASATTPPEGEA